MSYLARSVRPVARSSALISAARPLSSSRVLAKSVTESTKDTLDSVNKSAGQGLASALETGEKAAKSVKETIVGESKEAKTKAEEAATSAGQAANKTAADARLKKDELLEKGKSS